MHQLQLFETPEEHKKDFSPKQKQIKRKTFSKKNETDELKVTHHTHPRFKDTVENSEKYIEMLSHLSFDRLGKNLDIIREQMDYAFKKKMYASYELLYELEKQNFAARLIKFDREAIQIKRKIKKVKMTSEEIKSMEGK